MSSNKAGYNREGGNLPDRCRNLMGYHVIFIMSDGSMADGIIENVDGEGVTAMMGEDMVGGEGEINNNNRQFGPRRFRRYRRRDIPLSTLIGISLLVYPYIFPPFVF